METAPTSPTRKRFVLAALAPVVAFGGPLLCCFGSCGGNFYYMAGAPPIRGAVALVESSPVVREAIGGDADVSLVVTRVLERDFLHRGGRDRVYLITTVDGSRGEAMLTLDAVNVEGQGWAGTFSLTQQGHQVLRDGHYVSDGGGTILAGTFLPDGSPNVAP